MELLLRGELELELEPGDQAGVLRDPLFGRTVTLGPSGVAVALALQEPRSLEDVLAMVDGGGFPREKTEATLRLFAMLHLLEDIGDDVRTKVRAVWARGTELPYRQLPGARHACQGSGMCCKSFRLGPVTPEEAAVVNALPLRDAMPDLPDGDVFLRIENHLFLRTVDAHCLFLQPDHRCGIHAHFGEDKKPIACREFPIQIKATFREALVYNNHQCASHYVAQAAGAPLIDTSRLTSQPASGDITLFHPIVFPTEDTPVDYVQFVELEDALRAAMAAGPPLEQLAHAPAILDSFVEAARALPLGVDPAPHFAAWRARVPLVAAAPPPPPTEEDRDDVAALIDTLVGLTMPLFVDPAAKHEMDRDMGPLMSELLPVLAELQLRLSKLVPGTTAPPLEEPFASALTTSLRQAFAGALSLPDDRPLSGIGQAALAIACGFVGARERSLAGISRGHMLANRVLLPFMRGLFRQHPEIARSLVRVLPLLVSAP